MTRPDPDRRTVDVGGRTVAVWLERDGRADYSLWFETADGARFQFRILDPAYMPPVGDFSSDYLAHLFRTLSPSGASPE